MQGKGEKLIAETSLDDNSLDTWSISCAECVAKAFGEDSEHVQSFKDPFIGFFVMGQQSDPRDEECERRKKLTRRLSVLKHLVERIETELALESSNAVATILPDNAIWSLVHPKVETSSRQRFEAGHYVDAVEAALKELNSVIKKVIKKKTGQEFDGVPLMQKAFSPNQPVLVALDDISTESGKNIQQGYMQIFAGAMQGIRNPKAHANLKITKGRAWHLLFLASLLFHKWDERS